MIIFHYGNLKLLVQPIQLFVRSGNGSFIVSKFVIPEDKRRKVSVVEFTSLVITNYRNTSTMGGVEE